VGPKQIKKRKTIEARETRSEQGDVRTTLPYAQHSLPAFMLLDLYADSPGRSGNRHPSHIRFRSVRRSHPRREHPDSG